MKKTKTNRIQHSFRLRILCTRVFVVFCIFALAPSCFGEAYGNRGYVRKKVEENFPEQADRINRRFGLKPRGGEKSRAGTCGKYSVILIHGLDDPGKVWMNLAPALVENGFDVWVMNYPNDQPIRESAKFLSEEINNRQSLLKPNLVLVAHSMGGLAAREMLTCPQIGYSERAGQGVFPKIDHLIMVGTPNHGSNLAHFRVFAELREQVVHLVKGDFHWLMPILDGSGEAGADLLTESSFLGDLNRRTCPENLKMMVIAGIMSPLEKDETRRMVQKLSNKLSPSGKAVFDQVAEEVNSAFHEIGDGAVSLKSARLPGVPLKTVSGTHLSIIRNISTHSQRVPPAIPVILEYLRKNQVVGAPDLRVVPAAI